jgi:Ankyrin repeats (3 copies)/Ankyrin repeat
LNANKKNEVNDPTNARTLQNTMEDEIIFDGDGVKRTDAEKKQCFEAAILAYMEKEGNRFSRTAAMFKEEAQLGDANEMVVSGSVLEKGWEYLEYRRQLNEEELFEAFAEGDLALVQLHECVGAQVTNGILHGFHPELGRRGYSYNSRNPLYLAVKGGHFAIVRYLVEKGINMDKTIVTTVGRNGNDDGQTALIVAILLNRMEIAEFLLEKGCNVGLADCRGWTALHHAAQNNKPELVQLLLRFGANVYVVLPRCGRLALDVAIDNSDDEIADIIRFQMGLRERRMAIFLAYKAIVAEGAEQPVLVRLRLECPEMIKLVVPFL